MTSSLRDKAATASAALGVLDAARKPTALPASTSANSGSEFLLSLPPRRRDAFVTQTLRNIPPVRLEQVRDWSLPLPLPGAEPSDLPPHLEYHVVSSGALALAAGPPDLSLVPPVQARFRERAATEAAQHTARRRQLQDPALPEATARSLRAAVASPPPGIFAKDQYDALSVVSQRSVDYFSGTFTNAPPPNFVPLPDEFRGQGPPAHTLYMRHGDVDVFLLPVDPDYLVMGVKDVDALLSWRRPDVVVSQLAPPPRTRPPVDGVAGPVPRPPLMLGNEALPAAAVIPDMYVSPQALTRAEFEAVAGAKLNAHWFAALATEAMGVPGRDALVGRRRAREDPLAELAYAEQRSKLGLEARLKIMRFEADARVAAVAAAAGEAAARAAAGKETFMGQALYEAEFGPWVPPTREAAVAAAEARAREEKAEIEQALERAHKEAEASSRGEGEDENDADGAVKEKHEEDEDDEEMQLLGPPSQYASLLRRKYYLPIAADPLPSQGPASAAAAESSLHSQSPSSPTQSEPKSMRAPRLVLAGRARAVTQSNLSFRYLMEPTERARQNRASARLLPWEQPTGAAYPRYHGSGSSGRTPGSGTAQAVAERFIAAHAPQNAVSTTTNNNRFFSPASVTAELFNTEAPAPDAAAASLAALRGAKEAGVGAQAGTALHECVEVFEPALLLANTLRRAIEELGREPRAPGARKTVVAVVDHPLVDHVRWAFDVVPALSTADLSYLSEGYAAAFFALTGRDVSDPHLQASGRAMREVITGLRTAWTPPAAPAGPSGDRSADKAAAAAAARKTELAAALDPSLDPVVRAADEAAAAAEEAAAVAAAAPATPPAKGLRGLLSRLLPGRNNTAAEEAEAAERKSEEKARATARERGMLEATLDPRKFGLPAVSPAAPGTVAHQAPAGDDIEDEVFLAAVVREQQRRLAGAPRAIARATRDRAQFVSAEPGQWGVAYAMSQFSAEIAPRDSDAPALRALLKQATKPQTFDFFRTFHLDPANAAPWRKVTRLFAQIYGPYASRYPTCGNCEISEDVNGFYFPRCRRPSKTPYIAATFRKAWRAPPGAYPACEVTVSSYGPEQSLSRFRPAGDLPQPSQVKTLRQREVTELNEVASHMLSSLAGAPLVFANLAGFTPAPSAKLTAQVEAATRVRRRIDERERAAALAALKAEPEPEVFDAVTGARVTPPLKPAPETAEGAALRRAEADGSGTVTTLHAAPGLRGAADALLQAKVVGDEASAAAQTAELGARASAAAMPFDDFDAVVARFPPVPGDEAELARYERWALKLDPYELLSEIRLRPAPSAAPHTLEQAFPFAEVIANRVWYHPVLQFRTAAEQALLTSVLSRDLADRSGWPEEAQELVAAALLRVMEGERDGLLATAAAYVRGVRWIMRGRKQARANAKAREAAAAAAAAAQRAKEDAALRKFEDKAKETDAQREQGADGDAKK